eukprot:293268_1
MNNRLHHNYSHSTNSSNGSSVDFQRKRISIGKFRAIMQKSEKQYPVDEIVNDLHDGTGYIPIQNIATYTKRVKTVGNLLSNTNNDHVKDEEHIKKTKTI